MVGLPFDSLLSEPLPNCEENRDEAHLLKYDAWSGRGRFWHI